MWFQRTGQVYHTGLQRPASLCRSFGAAVVHQKLQSDVIWSSVLVQFQKTLLDILGKLISFIMSCKMMDTDKSIDDISLDSGFFYHHARPFYHPPCLLALHFLSSSKTCLHLSTLLLQFVNTSIEVIRNCFTRTMLAPYCCRLSRTPDHQRCMWLGTAGILLLKPGRKNK